MAKNATSFCKEFTALHYRHKFSISSAFISAYLEEFGKYRYIYAGVNYE
jgi:hypothetical protein